MHRAVHAALYVLGGTLFGLAHPMVVLGPGIFVGVWVASVLGDAVFIAGMAATYFVARRAPGWTAWPVALMLTWATYTFSWLITGDAMGDGGPDEAPLFVATWGWVGLLVCGAWPWVQRSLEERARLVGQAGARAEAP